MTARQVKLANGCPKHLPSGTYRVIRSDEGLTLEKSASKTFVRWPINIIKPYAVLSTQLMKLNNSIVPKDRMKCDFQIAILEICSRVIEKHSFPSWNVFHVIVQT